MCEYCENPKYTIRISVDEWIEKDKKFIPENKFDVNYCPMCGREFKGEQRKMEDNLIVNFNEEEAIITFSGLQIVIQKEQAINMSKDILDYFEEEE